MPPFDTLPFQTLRMVWSVDMNGSASVEASLTADQVVDWAVGTRITVAGPRDWGGEVTRLERAGPPGEGEKVGFRASGLGLSHRLDYRIVRHDLVVNDTADVIVEALLSEAQDNQFNGDMGFVMGTVSGTLVTRRRGYCVGVVIGDAIRELASLDRGFDWEVDADGSVNLWNRTRGVDTGLTLAETQTSDWNVVLDTSELLTNVTAIADPSDPFGPKFRMSRTAMANVYGRRDVSIDTDIIATTAENPDWEDELYDAGRAVLRSGGGGHLQLRTMWVSSKAPWDFGDVWLQDTVTVTLPAFFGGDTLMRCTDITVTLEPMPTRGVDAPVYWVEMGWDALVTDLQITDGETDEGLS